jgi:hypothetical protein
MIPMKKIILVVFALFSVYGNAQDASVFLDKLDLFLKMNVAEGKVAYTNIFENQNDLNELLVLAGSISISESDENLYQAFWINAYNLAVIKGIIDNYPINSPLDVDGFFDTTVYKLAGKQISLNDIEHKLLRAKFKDARVHFVLVCGAIGCPPLINNAYMPDTIEAQLTQQTRIALNGDFLKVDVNKKRVEVSEILKWYQEDFTQNGLTELDFINSYRNEKIPTNYKLTYSTYNWNLNTQ